MGRFTDLLFARRDSVATPSQMIGFPLGGGLLPSGVTAQSSYGLSAVFRSLDILSNGVSQLAWEERRGNLELPPSRLVRSPLPPEMATRRDWTNFVVAVLALYDWCYLLKVGGYDSEGAPVGLLPLEPSQVAPVQVSYAISPFIASDEYWVGTAKVPRDQLVILRRSPLAGVDETTSGLIRLARVEFAGYLAASGYNSRYWQAGGNLNTVLEADAAIPKVQKEAISDAWRSRRAMGPDYAPILDGGLKAREMGADPTMQSAVEVRKEMVADVGRYFGIPTSMLNAPTGDSTTYNTTEAQGLDLVKFTLRNYIGAVEDAISGQLPGGRHMVMDTFPLTVGSQLSQAQALQMLTGGKAVMDVDEAREQIGLGPVESPDTLNPPAPAPVMVAPGGTNA